MLADEPTMKGPVMKQWSRTDLAPERLWFDADLALKQARAHTAVQKLISGDPLETDDLIAFGRLNSFCFLMRYEPMVMLATDPMPNPALAEILRFSSEKGE